MKLARASVALLLIQLALVSSIAAKYLYQRSTCPQVWVKTETVDPESVMRGRYLNLSLPVNACEGMRPAEPPVTDTSRSGKKPYVYTPAFPTRLSVRNGKLFAVGISENEARSSSVWVEYSQGRACEDSHIRDGVDFYLSEGAKLPQELTSGRQLWVEVTVPPVGPPRPLGLAIKSKDGRWQPLSYQ